MLFSKLADGGRWPARLVLVAVVIFQAVAFAQSQKGAAPGERVLHLPPDRCLGSLRIYTGPITDPDELSRSRESAEDWSYFHEAQGDVTVPAGRLLVLGVDLKHLKHVSHLRRLKPDDLYSLGIWGSQFPPHPNQLVMPYLSGLTGLRELAVGGVKFNGSDLRHLAGLSELRSLRIYASEDSLDAGLPHLSKLRSIEYLCLDCRCTDAGVQKLAGLPTLRTLVLGTNAIQGPGLVHLEKLPALRSLTLQGATFSNEGLAYLKNLTALTHLHLRNTHGEWDVSNEGLAHLSHLTAMEELDIDKGKDITDAGLVHLKPMRSLKKLNLVSTQVTDVGLAQLAELKSLESLDLPGGVTDAGLACLANSLKLKELRVSGRQITNEGARHIARMRSLTDLSLRLTAVNDAGMDSIAELTNLENFSHNGIGSTLGHFKADGQHSVEFVDPKDQSGLTDQGLARLAPLKSLKSLYLYHANVTVSGLSHLNALPNLTSVDINAVRQDNAGMDISKLTKLETLWIDAAKDSAIRDEDLTCLAGLKNLSNLQFAMPEWMSAGDEGLKQLSGLTNLHTLVIGSKMTDDGLSYLKNMKKLRRLTIFGDFTDQGLRQLEGLNGLSSLRIVPERPFSRTALNRLQQALPCLHGAVETEDLNKKARAASTRRTRKDR